MRNKKVIVILLVFSLMFIFYGCSKDKKISSVDNDIKIAYREIILNDKLKAEDIMRIALNNKELVLLVKGDSLKYIVLDENSDIKKEINIDYEGKADVFTIDREDNIYILSEELDTNENKDIMGIRKRLLFYNNDSNSITEKNVIGEINDTMARSIEESTRKIRVDSKDNIYALKSNGSIEIFDSKLNSKKILDSKIYRDIEIDEEDNILALLFNNDEKAIDKIDGNNHKIIWSKEYEYRDLPDKIYYNKNTKSLYGMNSGWVLKYDSQGNMTNRLLNTAELSDIDFTFSLVVDNNEEVYIIADAEQKLKLINYVKGDPERETDTADTDKKTEITIDLEVDYGNLFTKAARKFQDKNPDIKVNVNLYPDLEGDQYSDKLNAELMAAKGPDIIYLPSWYNRRLYMEKDILVNLDEMIEKDKEFNIEDYNTHMIDNSRYKGKLYTMPISYNMFYSFMLNEKLLEEKGVTVGDDLIWKDIYALSKKLNENSKEQIYVLPEIDDYMLYDWIVWQDLDYYLDLTNKEAKFNSKEFIETLELLKAIKEDDIMHPDLSWYDIADKKLSGESVKNIAIYPGQTHAYHYIRSNAAVFGGFNAISAPKGEYTGNRLYHSNFLSINSNSKHREEVWEFIKFVLSEEVQATDRYLLQKNFHIKNNVSEKQIDEVIFKEQKNNEVYIKKNNEYFANEEDLERLSKMIANLNKPYISEPFHYIIYDEVQLFLDGEKTAEAVAEQLQNKAQIFLNE